MSSTSIFSSIFAIIKEDFHDLLMQYDAYKLKKILKSFLSGKLGCSLSEAENNALADFIKICREDGFIFIMFNCRKPNLFWLIKIEYELAEPEQENEILLDVSNIAVELIEHESIAEYLGDNKCFTFLRCP